MANPTIFTSKVQYPLQEIERLQGEVEFWKISAENQQQNNFRFMAEIERKDEALKKISEYDVSEEHGTIDEWSESQGFTACQKIAREAL